MSIFGVQGHELRWLCGELTDSDGHKRVNSRHSQRNVLDTVREFAALVLENAAQPPIALDMQQALTADATTLKAQVDSPSPMKCILGGVFIVHTFNS